MFLSDLSDNVALFRRKRYEEYLRENKPEVYTSLQNTRKELSDAINEQRVNPFSKKPVIAAVTKKKTKNTYRMLKEMGYRNTSKNNIRSGLRDLRRFEPLPNLKNTLPDLRNAQRGVKPLPTLTTPTRPVLPDLSAIPTPWNKPSFNVLAGKHDVTGVVNPVKDTFTATSGRKPRGNVNVSAPKPKTSEIAVSTNVKKEMAKKLPVGKLLAGLGVVSLGGYGLKKYTDSRKDKRP